jgi:hypothetical protein
LNKERLAQYDLLGIAEDHSILKVDEIVKNIKVARDKLPGFRKQAKYYSLEELKKQI